MILSICASTALPLPDLRVEIARCERQGRCTTPAGCIIWGSAPEPSMWSDTARLLGQRERERSEKGYGEDGGKSVRRYSTPLRASV